MKFIAIIKPFDARQVIGVYNKDGAKIDERLTSLEKFVDSVIQLKQEYPECKEMVIGGSKIYKEKLKQQTYEKITKYFDINALNIIIM